MTTVGRLARRHGLSRSTLLYYERIGLLVPTGHARGDYRHYGEDDEARLKRILDYRSAGVPLKDIARILDTPEESRVADVLQDRLAELRLEMDALAGQQRIIAGLLGRPDLLDVPEAMDKKTWTGLLEAAGFTDADMRRWHADFERTAPEKHERFLRFLNIPEGEIALIRSWAKAPHRVLNMKQITDTIMELFFKIYEDVERKGPGDREATKQALRLCKDLPEAPRILDIGCGSGIGSVYLAEETGGTVTAIDYYDGYVREAAAMAAKHGLDTRITAEQGDMAHLKYADQSFDLVWSEGAAYIMGFDNALRDWKRLVRPGGSVVISEAVWLTDTPDAELEAFWRDAYPAMRTVEGNARAAERAGYTVAGTFTLAESCWDSFYAELGDHLDDIEPEFRGNTDAEAIFEMSRLEAQLWQRYRGSYGYQYYVLQNT